MKAKKMILIGGLLLLFGGCLVSINATDTQKENVVIDEKYDAAVKAMDGIYKSITITDQDFDKGIVTIAISNTSDYDFNNMMVHMEFVNKKREAYYVETAFVFDGLKAGEERVISYEIADLNMLKDLKEFNFCTEGF